MDEGKTRVHKGSRNIEKSVRKNATFSLDSEKNLIRRNENPRFFYEHTGRLRDLKGDEKLIGRTRRSESPIFFCKESKKSATTYAMDSKTRKRLSPEFTRNMRRRSESPKFFDLKNKRKSTDQLLSEDMLKRSESPKYFCKESEKSATTYTIDSTSRSISPDFVKIKPRSEKNISIKSNFSIDTVDRKIKPDKSKDIDEALSSKTYDEKIKREMKSKSTTKRMPNVFQRLTGRSSSPKCLQTNVKNTKFSKPSDFISKISLKRIESPDSKSPNLTKEHSRRSSSSPQFFTSDSEKSATIMLVIPETIVKRKSDKTKQGSKSHKLDAFTIEPRRRMSEEIIDESSKHSIRSSVSRFFSDQCEKVSRNSEDGTRDIVQSAKGGWSRDTSPLSLKDMGTSRKGAEFSGKAMSATSIDSIRDWSPKSRRNSRSLTPQFPKNKNHPKSTENTLLKRSKSISQKNIKKSKSKSPEIIPDGGITNVLRSTRLIRDAMKHRNNNKKNEKDQGSRRNSMNAEEGISSATDLEKKVERTRRRRTPLSPSPTSISITCNSKNVTNQIITKENNKVENLNSGERKRTVNQSKIRNNSNDLIIPASKRINERVLHRKTPSPIQLKQKKCSSKSPQMTKESEILHSMELVRKVIKGESFDKEVINKTINSNEKKSDSTRKSSSTIVYINDESSRKNYKRTDSVESALRRFDSIGTESVQSSTEKRQTLEEATAISLKALNQIDANLLESLNRKSSLREISVVPREMERNDSRTGCQRKFARARDSIEMARITMGSKTAACKRKLFQDQDSGEETETGNSKSRYSLEKFHLKNEKILGNKNQLRDEEVSLSVKQLRSIEDIRKSIDSCFERKETSTKSAIANDTLKLKRLPKRSENLAGDAERSSIKCAIRFSRVTMSPSPDSTKTTETSSRARRNVLSSPSKSPDTVARVSKDSIELLNDTLGFRAVG